MVVLGPNREESMGSQCQDYFFNLERRRDQEVSVHTTHTSRSQSRGRSHLSHDENTRAMQLEIDHLKRKLRHEQRKRTPSNSDFSSGDEEDDSYRPRSRTPPVNLSRVKGTTTMGIGLRVRLAKGNDAMSKVLNQISRSPFKYRIEGGRLP